MHYFIPTNLPVPWMCQVLSFWWPSFYLPVLPQRLCTHSSCPPPIVPIASFYRCQLKMPSLCWPIYEAPHSVPYFYLGLLFLFYCTEFKFFFYLFILPSSKIWALFVQIRFCLAYNMYLQHLVQCLAYGKCLINNDWITLSFTMVK